MTLQNIASNYMGLYEDSKARELFYHLSIIANGLLNPGRIQANAPPTNK